MKKIIAVLFVMSIVVLSSCAKWKNKVDRDGAYFGSNPGDWVVLKQSGGVITDVWKIDNEMVQSEENSDGWLFKDANGNTVNVSGDTKAIRIHSNKEAEFAKYVEYHMEFDSLTYHQRLALTIK